MNKILKIILDFIFPIECMGCQAPGEFLCETCTNKIGLRNLNQCPLCNRKQNNDELCNKCKKIFALDKVIISSNYDNEILQSTLHFFKYKFVKDLYAPLVKIMIKKLSNIKLPENLIIIPTPLHRRRLIERGFNQAELLAKKISEHFKIPLVNNVLIRKKNNKHQANLNKQERLKNIQDCFVIKNKESIQNKNILLIDDVITTGATLNEQAKILKNNGANQIWALVLAKN